MTKVDAPIAATPSTGTSKQGKACAANYLGLIAIGDATIQSAKANGGITNVASVDDEAFSVLSLFSTFCTVVRGS